GGLQYKEYSLEIKVEAKEEKDSTTLPMGSTVSYATLAHGFCSGGLQYKEYSLEIKVEAKEEKDSTTLPMGSTVSYATLAHGFCRLETIRFVFKINYSSNNEDSNLVDTE
nr:hypothetical protein [Tanacetum cinerariifolium]